MTFLVDANILIDLGFVEGLDVLPALGPAEVLDIVLLECEEPPDLADNIRQAGIQEVEAQQTWIKSAQPYKTGRLSLPDVLSFYYAKTFNCTLLTNEKPLRNLCQQENVPFHGLLWVVEQGYHLKLRSAVQLCAWLVTIEQLGSRLPALELTQLHQQLGCQNLQNGN